MQTSTFTQIRQHLASTMDSVVANHNSKDFNAMQETAYLMQSSNNASRLNEAIEQLESGFTQIRDLIES